MARFASGALRFLPFVVVAIVITFAVFTVAVMPRPWYLLLAVAIAVFLALGYWTWGRTWRHGNVDRKDRQRRWGIRRRVDTDDRANARRK